MIKPTFDLEEARWWLEALAENLVDSRYCVKDDAETHFKIAAIQRILERNEELETSLSKAHDALDGIGSILSKVL